MKINVKVSASENPSKKIKRVNARVAKNFAAEEKQKQIDVLLDYFENKAANSPELVMDKKLYVYSKEFIDSTPDKNFRIYVF